MAFEEVRIPVDILYTSTGGPKYLTYISASEGGQEQRNAIWQIAKHSYLINYIKQKEDRGGLIDFFHAMRGMLHGFRFKDFNDYKSVDTHEDTAFDDVSIGTGDGVETEFQIIKAYPKGNQIYNRDILKPVSGSVKSGIDGVEKTITTDWTVNTTTGIITYNTAPANGLDVTSGFEFDVPVRFDTDNMDLSHLFTHAGGVSLPIVEIKDPE